MKTQCTLAIFCIFWLCLFLLTCGKKEQAEKEVVIIDSDTISIRKLSEACPDTVPSKKRIQRLCLTAAVAKQLPPPADTATFKRSVNDLADQLSRESGRVWDKDAAEKMYSASKLVKERLEKNKDVDALKLYIDSLAKKIKIPSDSGLLSSELDLLCKDSISGTEKKQLASIITSLFCPDERVSNIIVDFMYSENGVMRDTTDIDDLVKGLVFDSTSISKEKQQKQEKELVRRDNSALALKFRNQKSIKSTISKHIPNLEAIYKKELKIDPSMSGVIYVTFRVGPSGEVISAVIKSSEIGNSSFINPFLDYVKEIRFKSIPNTVGNMTFDFPFEFKPEI